MALNPLLAKHVRNTEFEARPRTSKDSKEIPTKSTRRVSRSKVAKEDSEKDLNKDPKVDLNSFNCYDNILCLYCPFGID